MSDDELDCGPEPAPSRIRPRYIINTYLWRSKELNKFLRTLDLLYLSTRFGPFNTATRGNWPRERVYNAAKVIDVPAVSEMPKNFYDKGWRRDLSDFRRRDLKMQPRVNLTIPDHLRLYVYNVSSPESPLSIGAVLLLGTSPR